MMNGRWSACRLVVLLGISVIGPMFGSGTLPRDAWEREFKFAAPGTHNPSRFDIWSSGADGADGTEDDIGNWKSTK